MYKNEAGVWITAKAYKLLKKIAGPEGMILNRIIYKKGQIVATNGYMLALLGRKKEEGDLKEVALSSKIEGCLSKTDTICVTDSCSILYDKNHERLFELPHEELSEAYPNFELAIEEQDDDNKVACNIDYLVTMLELQREMQIMAAKFNNTPLKRKNALADFNVKKMRLVFHSENINMYGVLMGVRK